jgi:hypothetical protein
VSSNRDPRVGVEKTRFRPLDRRRAFTFPADGGDVARMFASSAFFVLRRSRRLKGRAHSTHVTFGLTT